MVVGGGRGKVKNTLGPALRRMADKYPDIVGQAMRQETEIEATEARKRTPVDLGALVATVHAEGPFREGKRIYTMIVAGGPSVLYALYVHEDPDAFHPVGQWKYIESVINEARGYFLERIAKRAQLRQAL